MKMQLIHLALPAFVLMSSIALAKSDAPEDLSNVMIYMIDVEGRCANGFSRESQAADEFPDASESGYRRCKRNHRTIGANEHYDPGFLRECKEALLADKPVGWGLKSFFDPAAPEVFQEYSGDLGQGGDWYSSITCDARASAAAKTIVTWGILDFNYRMMVVCTAGSRRAVAPGNAHGATLEELYYMRDNCVSRLGIQ